VNPPQSVGFLHYSYHPIVGGVERVMRQHARIAAHHGHPVRILAGTGAALDPGIDFQLEPLLSPEHPLTAAAILEQKSGKPGPAHHEATQRFRSTCESLFAGCAVVWVHNLLTMPFNLAATEALWQWAASIAAPSTAPSRPRLIHWTHDLGAINPDYHLNDRLHQHPFSLLRQRSPDFEYVTISQTRQHEMRDALDWAIHDIPIVPNPIDPVATAGIEGPLASWLVERRFHQRSLLLFHPTRVLLRKNVEQTIRVTAALRRSGIDAAAIITGAPDPFNAASAAYGELLKNETTQLDDPSAIGFVQETVPLSDADVARLYPFCDLLFFPSRMEGFGLPVLEAAVFRVPTAAADISVLRELMDPPHTLTFDPDEKPETVAANLVTWLNQLPQHQWRRKLWDLHAIETIWHRHLAPMTQR